MDMKLQGKTAIITGGASGQGLATARLMAQEGARVVLADLNEAGAEAAAREIQDAGGQAIAIRTDVTLEPDLEAMVRAALDHFGRLDVLFNNAGIPGQRKSVLDMSDDEWDPVLAVNLKAVAFACKHAIPVMLEQGGGAIINNASINGLVAMRGGHAYTAAKGGVVALTRVLAVTWGPQGIRVNCICPGPVDTPMTAIHLASPEAREFFAQNWVIGRIGQAEEIAHVTVFLASDASSYVNGAILPVDGGWTAR